MTPSPGPLNSTLNCADTCLNTVQAFLLPYVFFLYYSFYLRRREISPSIIFLQFVLENQYMNVYALMAAYLYDHL